MITKSVILISCLAGAALVASSAVSAPRHARAGFGSHRVVSGTTGVAPNYTRYGGTWRSGSHRFHHRHHGGASFVFYGGFPYYYGFGYPYYGYYPYRYWGPPSYAYYNYSRPDYGYGDSLVVEVQRRLRNEGYYGGAIDGIAGPRTRAAIRAYERRHGLPVNGVIDDQLLGDLGVR